jgi:hypothetical protein
MSGGWIAMDEKFENQYQTNIFAPIIMKPYFSSVQHACTDVISDITFLKNVLTSFLLFV